MHTAEGSPLGLVASKNHSSPGYKYSRFLSMVVVCSPGYGWVLETSVVDWKQSHLRGYPRFSTLYDADLFLGPLLSYFLWEVDKGWLVMALALWLESLLGKNPHS
jgi:hypothetical protein